MTRRGRIVSVTRPAYVSAGLDSSYYLDDADTTAETPRADAHAVTSQTTGSVRVRLIPLERRTPIGSGGAAWGLPLPSSVEPSLRAGVQGDPTSSNPSAQNTQAGAGPPDKEG